MYFSILQRKAITGAISGSSYLSGYERLAGVTCGEMGGARTYGVRAHACGLWLLLPV